MLYPLYLHSYAKQTAYILISGTTKLASVQQWSWNSWGRVG